MQPNPYKGKMGRVCDPLHWYMSEKLDGMKGRWVNGSLQTRSGKKLHPPAWFVKLLPPQNIEGELYFGLDSFHRTGSLRKSSSGQNWTNVVFHVFDLIDYSLTWLERQAALRRLITVCEHVQLVQWRYVQRLGQIEEYFRHVTTHGGEGIILADPWGLYEDGHVDQILKYKKNKDSEAIVVGYRLDDSKDRLVSLEVHPYSMDTKQINRQLTFHIGTGLKMKQRYNWEKNFPLNCIVTYTYELIGRNGKPRTPVLKGVRADA